MVEVELNGGIVACGKRWLSVSTSIEDMLVGELLESGNSETLYSIKDHTRLPRRDFEIFLFGRRFLSIYQWLLER